MTPEDKAHLRVALSTCIKFGCKWESLDYHFPAGSLIDFVESEFNLTKKERDIDDGPDGFSANGWQWDWWQRFEADDGKRYVLSGSGYDGGHSFSPEELE